MRIKISNRVEERESSPEWQMILELEGQTFRRATGILAGEADGPKKALAVAIAVGEAYRAAAEGGPGQAEARATLAKYHIPIPAKARAGA